MNAKIEISKDAIAAFCQRNHIRRLAFFGSVLRDDFGPESDVDVLVEFEPGQTPGLKASKTGCCERQYSGPPRCCTSGGRDPKAGREKVATSPSGRVASGAMTT